MRQPPTANRLPPSVFSLRALAVLFAALLVIGCPRPEAVVTADAGVPDAGQVIKLPVPDAGVDPPRPDAGLVYPASTAAEPCPPETFGMFDSAEDG